jgi:hypothetical protein
LYSVIYKTTDNGKTFNKIYTTDGLGRAVYVEKLLLDSNSPDKFTIRAMFRNGNLVKSTDAGISWSVVSANLENDPGMPIDSGTLYRQGKKLYYLVSKSGNFYTSTDLENYSLQDIFSTNTSTSSNNATTNTNNSNNKSDSDSGFRICANSDCSSGGSDTSSSSALLQGSVRKIIESPTSSELAIVTDNKIYLSEGLGKAFVELKIPIDSQNIKVTDLAFDPKLGSNKMIVSLNQKIFESVNKGQSWVANFKISQPVETFGNIGQIIIDQYDPRKIFLVLYSPSVSRASNIFSI